MNRRAFLALSAAGTAHAQTLPPVLPAHREGWNYQRGDALDASGNL